MSPADIRWYIRDLGDGITERVLQVDTYVGWQDVPEVRETEEWERGRAAREEQFLLEAAEAQRRAEAAMTYSERRVAKLFEVAPGDAVPDDPLARS